MQKIFTHPNLPESITEIKLIKGISGAWLIFITDKFNVVSTHGVSSDQCPDGIPPDADLLWLAGVHTKFSMAKTLRN